MEKTLLRLVTTGSVDKEYTHLAYSVIILITFVVTVGLFRDESAVGDAPLKEADVQKVYGSFERTSILNEPVQIDSIWKSCDACARDERAFAKAIFATDSARLIAYLREQSVQDSVVSKMSEKQRSQLQEDLLRQHRAATTNEAARIFDDIAFRQNLTDAINEYLQDYDPQLLTRLCEDFSITEDTYLVDETFKDTPVAPPDGKALTFLKGAILFKKTMKKILVTKAKKRSSDGVLSELTIIRYQ